LFKKALSFKGVLFSVMNTIKSALQIDPQLKSLDKEVLLAHVLKVDRSYLIAHNERELINSEFALYQDLLARRKNNEPIAYIVGSKEFYGRNFVVNNHTLIPRPESEHLIDHLKTIYHIEDEISILDVGTGTGCLAITAALEFPNSQVTAIELYPQTVEVARTNNLALCTSKLVTIIESDLLSALPAAAYFDCILANLPYICQDSADVGAETSQYEPTQALYSGKDGLDHYRLLFTQLADRHLPFKNLICEIGLDQSRSIQQLAKAVLGKEGNVYNDLADKPRIFVFTN